MSITNLRFLVAEDHEFQRCMVVAMLASLGIKNVREAPDGRVALAIIQDTEWPVDIIITDIDMPGMDGMEFLRRLGELQIPTSVILTSALEHNLLASIETMIKMYDIPLLGVVPKPLTPEKLQPLIERHKPAQAALDSPKATDQTYMLEEIIAGLKNDEFEPFFQPKIELSSGRVKGTEALARWRHAQHGIVAPYAFISLLEDNGLIDELTWVMLKKAAAGCRSWRAAGVDSTVSVNLSPKSLSDVSIADRVTELVRKQLFDPHHMVLEVTESAAATDIGKALENLARLRMKGFILSIDDYGTGYSSIQQLTRIAFTELKIDQSFVTNAATQEPLRVILESSLDMAKKLNIASVAEGVETQADWDLLQQLGCDFAQGYFIARPMEVGAYLDWLRSCSQSTAYRKKEIPQ